MRAPAILAATLCLASAWAWPASSANGGLDLGKVDGVYKTRFPNGLVSGETYTSENILEIVRTAPDQAYVRAHLEFYNGHLCSLHGVARVEGSELVYRAPDGPAGSRACVLRMVWDGPSVAFHDDGSCRSYCGMRGAWEGITFPSASRRPIRYMSRLKASWQYRDALANAPRR